MSAPAILGLSGSPQLGPPAGDAFRAACPQCLHRGGLASPVTGRLLISIRIQHLCYNIDYDEDHGIWCTATYNHGIATSTDGETWTHEANGTGTVYFSEVCYRNKMWVGKTSVYAGGLYYSKDGLNWKQSNLTSEIFSQVFYGNKKWFACSYYSTFDPSSYSGVYTSIGAE